MWSVAEARANFSVLLKRARAGEPQIIRSKAPCVLIALDEYKRLKALEAKPQLGKWLVENLRGLGEIELPSHDDNRPIPIAGWKDFDFGD